MGKESKRLVVNQHGDHFVIDVLGIVPLSTGVHVGNFFAHCSLVSQRNSVVTNHVEILDNYRASVEYWRQFIPTDGMFLDELVAALGDS